MQTSAGVIITDGTRLLLGHVTNHDHWDIPKGCVDEGESYIDAALRELYEETNISLTASDVSYLGRYDYYRHRKELELFLYKTNNLPHTQKMFCSSMVEDDVPFPEIDAFKYVEWDDVHNYVTPRLLDVLCKIHTQIIRLNGTGMRRV